MFKILTHIFDILSIRPDNIQVFDPTFGLIMLEILTNDISNKIRVILNEIFRILTKIFEIFLKNIFYSQIIEYLYRNFFLEFWS